MEKAFHSIVKRIRPLVIRPCLGTALLLMAAVSAYSADSAPLTSRYYRAGSPVTAMIPLDSPVYFYLDKLAGLGLISSDVTGRKPYSNVKAARLVQDAERTISVREAAEPAWSASLFRFIPPRKDSTELAIARGLVTKTRELLPGEAFLPENIDKIPLLMSGESGAPRRIISSANIPLGSPIYGYLEKLAGMGLVTTDVRGLRPYSKAEAARLVLEAQKNLSSQETPAPLFAGDLIRRIRELLPREVFLRENPDKQAPLFDYNPISSLLLRYVYLDGAPRDYNRISKDPGHQSAFGFIGGDLRNFNGGPSHTSGTEGTPLLENNNGVIHPRGNSGELRWAAEAFVSDKAVVLIEPVAIAVEGDSTARLNRAYAKLGGGGLELEVGREENWFGPGYRGTTTLTNNARNFDLVKLSSPEPVDVDWIRRWAGDVKYSLFVSQFDETDVGTKDHRQPWLVGFKLAAKPKEWFEIGANFVRQTGGPGLTGSSDTLFGGGYNDHSNSIAGLDLRFRIPWLRNTEIHGEFSGEDNAGGVWPIVESYVAGLYVPCLTDACRDDFRFEYFFGSVMLYGDWQYPRGYAYHNMTPGHSQGGGGVQEFFGRYSHWFGVRNNLALEYFYTERGRSYRMPGQVMESKHAGRVFWNLPVYGDVDAKLMYGIEEISNLNLVEGARRTNQLVSIELQFKY